MNAKRNRLGVGGSILLLTGLGCGSDEPKQIPKIQIDAALDDVEKAEHDAGETETGAADAGTGGDGDDDACFTGTPSRMEDFLNACSDVATAEKEPMIPLAKDGVVTKIPNAL